jgi:phosphate transport system protein
MELHFDQELSELREAILRMSALAEQSVAQSLKALVERDSTLASRVREDDTHLDQLEKDIDERCIKLIALRQPKARDLRFIVMTMKIATELERIGDQAVSIAGRAIKLNQEPVLKPLIDIPRMADHARGMIHAALDAFVYGKADLARDVIRRDERIDLINQQLHRELTSFMVEDPHTISSALNLMTVARKLERMADHATNIAEEVVYLYEGLDIRHEHEP